MAAGKERVLLRLKAQLAKLDVASVVAMAQWQFVPPVAIVGFLMMIVSFFIYVRLLLSLRESLKSA